MSGARWLTAVILATALLAPAPSRAQSDSAAATVTPAAEAGKQPAEAPAPAASAAKAPAATASGTQDECMTCHLDAETPEALAYRHDIHRARGVTCADCHGGDPHSDDQDAAMNKAKGFIGVPKSSESPSFAAPATAGRIPGSRPGTS